MIYYNESLALNEAGFDVVDALMECPIYDKYENMIESITSYGFMNESEKTEFRILEENVFETIGNALKKAWGAIVSFFKFLAGKVSGFFKKLNTKKVADAVIKKCNEQQKEIDTSKMNPEKLASLTKKYGTKITVFENLIKQNDKHEYTNYCCLDTAKLTKETIRTTNTNAFKAKIKKIPLLNKIKSNEQADKYLKNLSSIEFNEKDRTTIIEPKDVKAKIQSCINEKLITKFFPRKVVIENESYFEPKTKAALVEEIYGLSNVTYTDSNSLVKLFNEIVKLGEEQQKAISGIESLKGATLNGYENKALNGIVKLQKSALHVINLDKHALNLITEATMKSYKDVQQVIITCGTSEQKKTFEKDKLEQKSNLKESSDPWAGLEESYDPWAGLD